MATVLVVEKEANLRLLLELELSDALHQCVSVADRDEVDDALRLARPDVVVLGVGTHVSDEFQIFYWLKRHHPTLPIVLYGADSGFGDPAARRQADACVRKRSDPEPLMHTIQRLSQHRQPIFA